MEEYLQKYNLSQYDREKILKKHLSILRDVIQTQASNIGEEEKSCVTCGSLSVTYKSKCKCSIVCKNAYYCNNCDNRPC